MRHVRGWSLALLLALVGVPAAAPGQGPDPSPATRNLVLLTSDGVRWQEVFRGVDEALLNAKDGGVPDVEDLRRRFWRETPEARREALMPFLWGVIARQGQIYGNLDAGSSARVTNGKNFSYPGYNEILAGAADPRIDSNAKRPNPNVTVLEWLNAKPEYRGKVAAFSGWDVGPFILNRDRSGLYVNGGWELIVGEDLGEFPTHLNRLMRQLPRRWADCRDDAITFPMALDYLRTRKPRALFVLQGDTDEHAHHGRYDLLLDAIHEFDADVKRLWETLQAMSEYRGKTSLILATDHGRGDAPEGWKSHGANIKGAEQIWMAFLGPDTPPLGERKGVPEVTQSQITATAAALLGEDYRADFPHAAPPIADATRPRRP